MVTILWIFGVLIWVAIITTGAVVILRKRKQHRKRLKDLQSQIRHYEVVINPIHF